MGKGREFGKRGLLRACVSLRGKRFIMSFGCLCSCIVYHVMNTRVLRIQIMGQFSLSSLNYLASVIHLFIYYSYEFSLCHVSPIFIFLNPFQQENIEIMYQVL